MVAHNFSFTNNISHTIKKPLQTKWFFYGRDQQLIAPQQLITCPLTYDDMSLARKSATFATSSGVPARRRGIVFAHSARISSEIADVISVTMNPGAMQFALIPRGPISLAMDFASPIKPAFDAE